MHTSQTTRVGGSHNEKLGIGCGILFSLPFCAVGLGTAAMAVQRWLHHQPKEAAFLTLFAVVFGGVGFGLLAAMLASAKRWKRTLALKEQFPDEPWRWEPRWAPGRIESSTRAGMIFTWCLALFWNAVSLPAVLVVPREWNKGNHAILFVLLFPLVGIGFLVWAVRATLAWRKFGNSVFEMASVPGVIGGRLGGVILVNAELRPEDGYHLTLSCVNRVTTGSGKHRSTREDVLWEAEQTMSRELLEADSRRTAIPVSFLIPFDCRPTDNIRPDNCILWRLEARAKVPGLDYHAQFEVPVFRSSESSPHPPSAPDPAAAFRAAPLLPQLPADSGIRVRPGRGMRQEFHFGLARNPTAAWIATICFLLFAGGAVLAWHLGAPWIVPILLGLFALLLL